MPFLGAVKIVERTFVPRSILYEVGQAWTEQYKFIFYMPGI